MLDVLVGVANGDEVLDSGTMHPALAPAGQVTLPDKVFEVVPGVIKVSIVELTPRMLW